MAHQIGNQFLVNGFTGGTLYFMGDSIAANNWISASNNFTNFAAEGIFNHANAQLGQAFVVSGSVATAGTLAKDFKEIQVPQVLALAARPEFVFVVTGYNSLYSVTPETTANTLANIIQGLDALWNAGITPIYTTILAAPFSNSSILQAHKQVNDGIRQYWKTYRRGIFWDGFKCSVDPDSTQFANRSGWYYSGPHPNNLGAYWLGKYCATEIAKQLQSPNLGAAGSEDYVSSTDYGNLLTNPMMTGTGGTAGTGVTAAGGTPDGWTVQRVAGTPTATLTIVGVTDPATGLKTGNAIQLAITAGAANDEIQIFNTTSLSSRMGSGQTYEAEGRLTVSGPTNVDMVRARVRADSGSSESGWFLSNSQTAVNYPEGFSYYMRSRQIVSLAAPVTGLWEARIRFSAAGSATFTVSEPRVRRIVS